MKGRVWQDPRSGDWVVILNLGRHPDGRRNCPWVGRFGPKEKKKAEAFLVDKLHELQTGTYVDTDNITVAEWGERWLAHYVQSVAEDTKHCYTQIVRDGVGPDLGHVRMQKLDKAACQALIAKWASTLKPSTVRLYATVLRAMLKEAAESGVIQRNPAANLSLPKMNRPDRRALSVQEMNDLLAKLEGDRLYLPTLIAVTTGLRRGEVIGLKWSSIDGNVLHMQRSITEKGVVKDPKSARGRRTIVLPQTVVDALAKHKRQQAADRLAAGPAWRDEGWVLTRADGGPWSTGMITGAFTRRMKALGIDLCFHELRHTHGSQMLEAGYSVNLVAERLGHDPSETLRTYAHVIPGADARVAETMDGLLASTAQK